MKYLIDVRSPREFAHSHIPNAINMPVLNDREYESVGTIYKNISPLKAKMVGSAMICRNIATMIENHSDEILHPKNELVIYCARGGNRSQSLYLVLSSMGFNVTKMLGGYKKYREDVVLGLKETPTQQFITLYGPSGCGKSEIIQSCSDWSIDIESMAKHYGSSFGAMANEFSKQPSMKMFENMLFCELKTKKGIVLVECESKKIGEIILPSMFFNAYQNGIKIHIDAPMEYRIKRTKELYADIKEENFLNSMEKIKPYMNSQTHREIVEKYKSGNIDDVAKMLLESYYDKVYKPKECEFYIQNTSLEETLKQIEEIKNLISSKMH